MKQTAVEWLINQMKQRESQGLTLSMYELEMFGEQSKAMEKEQIINAYNNGDNRSAELYYNETFKS